MIIVRVLLDIILILMSYIVPKKKNSILFGAAMGKKYNGDPKYLFEYLEKNNEEYNIKYFWITKNKKLYKELRGNNDKFLYQYSLKGLYIILRSQIFIIDHLPADILPLGEVTLGKFFYINTWHGTFLKKIGKEGLEFGRRINLINREIQTKIKFKLYDLLIHFDLFLVSSKINREKLNKCFSVDKIIMLNNPRQDALFSKKINTELYELYNLDKFKSIVLYAPTWRDYDTNKKPFNKNELIKINDYCKRKNIIIICKKHPLDTNISFGELMYSNIKELDSKFEDIFDILKHTTILITDYSGTYFDYMLLDRPTIFYRYDHEEYLKNCRSLFEDIQEKIPGPFVDNISDLIEKIDTCEEWYYSNEYQKKVKEAKREFNVDLEGEYCKKFFDYLKKIMIVD